VGGDGVARGRGSSRAEASISLRGAVRDEHDHCTARAFQEASMGGQSRREYGAESIADRELYGPNARHRAVPKAPKFLRLRTRDDVQRKHGKAGAGSAYN
jgi:hypothetical protein